MAILSIQSHVVYGYAGNSAAVFPMQRLGKEVWALNTVEFSNHTGYGAWRGKVLGAELAADLVRGIAEQGLLGKCEAVLSGYLGSAEAGQVIADTVRLVKAEAKNAVYCCDPVMGDTGKGLYVNSGIPEIFKNDLLALADIITPNQFELETLTGIKTGSPGNAVKAINALHEKGPSVVLVTSYYEENSGAADKQPRINMLASDKSGVYRITTPLLPLGTNAAGTGDLTAAVFLSRYLESGDIKRTLELCTSSVFGILKKSFSGNSIGKSGNAVPVELRIIEAQEELVSPADMFKAEKI